MNLVSWGFYLHGADLVVSGKEKIDFVIMFSAVGGEGVKVKLVAWCTEHLRNGILVDISKIGGQFVT